MRIFYLIITLLCISVGEVGAASNDVLLNLRDPASTSPLFPTLRVTGPADGGTNPTVKLPTLPCVANAAAPTWPEGSIVPCSVDLAGGMRQSGGGGGGGNGAILDFVNNLIGATVRDYLNSNPLAVVLTDTNGDAYLASGGTQYAQGTAATDTDLLTLAGCVRADTAALAAGVADGDRARCIVDGTNRLWTHVGAIDGGTLTSITNPVAVTGTFFQATQPISAVALPLPTGAATEATLATLLTTAAFQARINTLGQKTMANSTPVVLASDQTSIPVAATVSNAFLLDATFTGRLPAAFASADNIAAQTATFIHGGCYGWDSGGGNWDRCLLTAGALNVSIQNATLAVTQSGTWNIGTVTTLTSITNPVAVTGTFFQATQPVSIAATVTVQGAKTNNNAAPGATNVGVLPCIANAAAPSNTEGNQTGCSQNLLGAQRTIEQNFVATSNNDGACPSGAASFTALASNASRTWAAVWASPANTDDVYLKLGATATAADARFAPGQPLNFTAGRIYTGVIDAFPASGTQAVCVMELN